MLALITKADGFEILRISKKSQRNHQNGLRDAGSNWRLHDERVQTVALACRKYGFKMVA